MTPEEKQILIQDLCARLPYRFVEIPIPKSNVIYPMTGINIALGYVELAVFERLLIEDARPYLRPMSSMTKEEEIEWFESVVPTMDCDKQLDFYCKYHFDYRGLIEKGLAIEAPEGMYKEE